MEVQLAIRTGWSAADTRISSIGMATPAPAPRLAKLQTTLAGSGYAVIGVADPGALAQLATADIRPVDAALIDAGWLHRAATGSLVEDLFRSRNVPYVAAHGDMRAARSAIDMLLEVIGATSRS
jgi:hypothetical protein